MKMRNKGKVHPSPSSSPSPSFSVIHRDASSVLKLLPTAILALASVLSIEDQEVLTYMITRSMKSENPYSMIEEKRKKSNTHKPPVFDCGCFNCYTSYWFRWDSSPNRELIHQAIEAFEEHLANGEQSKKSSNNRANRKRDKMGRRKPADVPEKVPDVPEIEDSFVVVSVEDVNPVVVLPLLVVDEKPEKEEQEEAVEDEAVVFHSPAANNDKGLARKVLPDVLGLFNSRLWNLWSPKA
ncbi:uncharacterized protein LOC132279364 [Cornus florida]|uniref:uncharacterized protein LOC132279364 n=1 Tax=Cornus florida TaxID=4283 RepID=UPI002899207F|nr:uncharacterized protein LOC132279364 [Cornus florida]